MSCRTGRPVGDRTGRPVGHRSSEAQIRNRLDKQKEKILAECQAKKLINTNFKQLEPKKINNEIKNFKDNHCTKIWNYVKLIISLNEMEKLRKFQSFYI